MTADAQLAQLAERAGIFPAFTDMQGQVHATSPETYRALLAALGLPCGSDRQVRESLAQLEQEEEQALVPQDLVIGAHAAFSQQVTMPVEWSVLSENGRDILAEGRAGDCIEFPPLPAGVHVLRLVGKAAMQEASLIVTPPKVPSLEELTGQKKTWGVVAAFYGLTTDKRKKLADFRDLAALARALGRRQAGFLGINPVHALGAGARDTISPYSPTHRGFLNTDHIASDLNTATRASGNLIDYAQHRQAQGLALAKEYEAFKARSEVAELAAFDAFCASGGAALRDFATFEAISESKGPDWRMWPDAGTGDRLVQPDRLRFHTWMQWRADEQLTAAQRSATSSGMSLGLYLDLAVGARAGGAESWGEHAATAPGVTLGAPPDHLSPAGQNWQLAALSPRRLRKTRYDALRFVLRQNMRHCGVLRIDHALGLNRSFWIPENGVPGGYVRQPFQSLMAVIAIEAQRAGTVVVGEDLGLVPPGFRDEMAGRGLYGYSVLQYEKDAQGAFHSARHLRPQSLACFGTHDTPTLAGFWQGCDIEWWEKLGWITSSDAARAMDVRATEKRQLAGLKAPLPLPRKPTKGLRDTVHAELATSPAAMVAVQLDDILMLSDAQNLPGTINEHPNWRRSYPLTVQQIADTQDLKKTADIMAKAGRASKMRKDIS